MFKNYLKVAARSLWKHRGTSLINVAGLAAGIACSLLIWLFVSYEKSYDRFHENGPRMYRLAVRARIGDTRINQTYSSSETLRTLRQDFPEIEEGVKFLRLGQRPVVPVEETFYENRFYAVDAPFFEFFSIPLVAGDPRTVLVEPNSLVLTRSTAERYYSRTDVLGRRIKVDLGRDSGPVDFIVTGVSEDVPGNSHFHYDLLASSASFPERINDRGFTSNNFITYLRLREGVTRAWFDEQLKAYTRRHMGGEQYDARVARGDFWEFFLQPIAWIHLDSDLNGEFEANGNRGYVLIFSIVSVFVLLVACINFMNLATAKSSLRAREVGLRKIVGAGRRRLVLQFLSEAVLMSLPALGIGVGIAHLLLPAYRNLIGRDLHLSYAADPVLIPALLGLGLLVGLVSGAYPAFVLSSFRPISIFRAHATRGRGGALFRKTLVVMQFAVSIFLILGTLVVARQLSFVSHARLGFEKDQVVVVQNPGALGTNVDAFKQALRAHPEVLGVTGSNTLPGQSFSNTGFGAEGVPNFTLNTCVCDEHFLETMGMELAAGRFFSREFPTDSHAAVLNETAARVLGWADPVGKRINNWNPQGPVHFTVVGVVKDFHYESLHQEIRPQALFLSGGYYTSVERNIPVRLAADRISEGLGAIERTWRDFAPGRPFAYSFLDRDYDDLYANERQIQSLFLVFALVAISIAALGLFGLASFTADRKTREIGIRKVLGASVPRIVSGLNRSFAAWALTANLVAWPAAWLFMGRWLRNFAYRVDMAWWMFAAAAGFGLLIALATVSLQTVRAALRNPAESLRFE